MYVISQLSKLSLRPLKKYLHQKREKKKLETKKKTKRKLPRSRPNPFPRFQTGPSP